MSFWIYILPTTGWAGSLVLLRLLRLSSLCHRLKCQCLPGRTTWLMLALRVACKVSMITHMPTSAVAEHLIRMSVPLSLCLQQRLRLLGLCLLRLLPLHLLQVLQALAVAER